MNKKIIMIIMLVVIAVIIVGMVIFMVSSLDSKTQSTQIENDDGGNKFPWVVFIPIIVSCVVIPITNKNKEEIPIDKNIKRALLIGVVIIAALILLSMLIFFL